VQLSEREAGLRYRITLLGPIGNANAASLDFDVTERVMKGTMGAITQSTELDFLQLTHGDVDLRLDNSDDAITQFFAGVQPTDRYDVVITRKSGRRRPLWQRVFGGVLDLPWSLRFDDRDRTCRIQVFSYSKHAERFSAEGVKRNVTGRTLTSTLSAGSATVNVSSTTDILPGDEIEITDADDRESHVVLRIVSGTQLITTETWDNTFLSGSPVELLTPYLRNKGIAFLAGELLDAAGIDAQAITIEHELATAPIATPISTDGWPLQTSGDLAAGRGWTVRNGKLLGLPTASDPDDREIADPRSTWVDQNIQTFILDWTPYRDTEPGTHPTWAFIELADGIQAPDYSISDTWYAVTGGGNIWNLNLVVGGLQTLIQNFGADVATITVEVIPTDPGNIWVSQVSTAAKTMTRYWDGAIFTTIEAAMGGTLRYIRRLNVVALHERNASAGGANPTYTTNLHLYDVTTRTKQRTITVPTGLFARTLRVFGTFIAGLYTFGPTTRCRVWDLDWKQVADYEVAQRGVPITGVGRDEAFLTVFTEPVTLKEEACGFAGNSMFVLATSYAGVIPYADFEGLSVAGALVELAKPAGAYIEIDEYGVGSIRSRLAEDAQRKSVALGIDEPLSASIMPLWEFYRTSAQVSGRTEAGAEIEELAGDTGDSAHRIEVSGPLITTPSVAQAIGNQYVSLLSQKVRQAECTVCEVDDLVPVFSYATFDGSRWLVIESSLKPDGRTYSLRLVEVG